MSVATTAIPPTSTRYQAPSWDSHFRAVLDGEGGGRLDEQGLQRDQRAHGARPDRRQEIGEQPDPAHPDCQAGRSERIAAHRPRVQAEFGADQQQDPDHADDGHDHGGPVGQGLTEHGVVAREPRLFKSAYGVGPRDYHYHAHAGRVNG